MSWFNKLSGREIAPEPSKVEFEINEKTILKILEEYIRKENPNLGYKCSSSIYESSYRDYYDKVVARFRFVKEKN